MTSHSTVDNESAPLAQGRSLGLIKQGLQMAHLNIRSIMCKFDEVKQILYDNEIDIIGFTETHLRNEISDVEIDICGYTLVRRDRTLNDGHGGVLLYVKNYLNYIRRNDLESKDIEAMFFIQEAYFSCLYLPSAK